jgi:phosphate transport system protein
MTAHFLNLMEQTRRQSLRMASQVEDMLHEACEAVFEPNAPLALRVIERDREIDTAEVAVEAEVIRLLALYQPVGRDLRLLCTILKVNSELECVADCAVNIAERARHLVVQEPARNCPELRQLIAAVRAALRTAIQAFGDDDEQTARRVIEEDSAIDAVHGQIVRTVVATDMAPNTLAAYLDLISVAKNLERIADHAAGIAKDIVFCCTGHIVRHRADHPV